MSHPSEAAPAPTAPASIADDVVATPRSTRRTLKFSEALAQVEHHRNAVRATLGVALLARLAFEYRLPWLLRESANLQAQLPVIGLALLSYLVVLWFLTTRTHDRFGFGMALGIGVLEATYLVVAMAMQRPFTVMGAWPLALAALAHVPMAVAAFKASADFPPHDGKQPWLVGFATALVFLAIPWVAPAVIEWVGRHR